MPKKKNTFSIFMSENLLHFFRSVTKKIIFETRAFVKFVIRYLIKVSSVMMLIISFQLAIFNFIFGILFEVK